MERMEPSGDNEITVPNDDNDNNGNDTPSPTPSTKIPPLVCFQECVSSSKYQRSTRPDDDAAPTTIFLPSFDKITGWARVSSKSSSL
eukprot:CAMPEP_0118691608 /NCGR_PEP_ID=MMETSP0800-20121206/10779_1 /TAXON_ID=210618 ORGANISM="Striatella unipunctata, Strain CCMP2910" /NCGR_SAMPLE_ID=MMETSP0800 /ASSEMBLY_ACC=CAM_ASM_000638 /LENGTH=86 /DNA_ID=CAMNT_0006589415 /DNA_START=165 /DNA_END=425 /DNA_ORIENTATION=+